MRETGVTSLLQAWRGGSAAALDELSALVYPELRRIAASVLRRERLGHTLQPTALVHEAFLRLAGGGETPSLDDRAHFLSLAARLMRQILIEHARRRQASKRGGGRQRVTLDENLFDAVGEPGVAIDLDDALRALEQVDRRKAQFIEMRYFGGLTTEEIAAVAGVSGRTVERELRVAHAWLYRELARRR